ncbi:MAG TPA: helix-turn-helix domain-containing protein, partial [Candidatus Paceibacterota bacterium]
MEPLLEKNLLSTKVASEISGYSSDYLSRLARAGKIEGVQVGRTWLVHRASLEAFMRTQDIRKEELSRSLAREREREYVQARGYEAPPRKIPSIVPEGASTARIADSVKDPRTAPLNTRAVREILGALARGPMPSIALSFLVVASSASAAALGLPQQALTRANDVASAAANGARMIAQDYAADVAARINDASESERIASARAGAAIADAMPERAIDVRVASVPVALAAVSAHASEPRAVAANDRARAADAGAEDSSSFVAGASSAAAAFADHPIDSIRSIPAALENAYLAAGESAYGLAARSLPAYVALVNDAGAAAYAQGGIASDAIASVPARIVRAEIAFGTALPRATNAVLGMYAHATYAYADAAPDIAPATIVAFARTGDALATAAADVLPSAQNAYVRSVYAFSGHSSDFMAQNGALAARTGTALRALAVGRLSAEPVVADASNQIEQDAGDVAPAPHESAAVRVLGAAGKTAVAAQGATHAASGALAGTFAAANEGGSSLVAAAWRSIAELTGPERAAYNFYEFFHRKTVAIARIFSPSNFFAQAPATTVAVNEGTTTNVTNVTNTGPTYVQGGTTVNTYPTYYTYAPQLAQAAPLSSDQLVGLRNDVVQFVLDQLDKNKSHNSSGGGSASSANSVTNGTITDSAITGGTISSTTITGSTFSGTNVTADLGSFDTLDAALATIAGLTATNSTTTNATTTNLFASNLTLGAPLLVSSGGTGSTSLSGILLGDGTNPIRSLIVGSGLAFDGTTLSSTAGGGSVTSVNASGGTTGLTFSGGPVTGAGTLTLGGVLGIANGGTGTSTAPGANKLLLSDATGHWQYVATSSLGITSAAWGNITGSLANQTDLQNALNAKLDATAFGGQFYSYFHATTTDALAEGTTNKYYTDARATANFIANLAGTTSVSSITTLPNLALATSQLSGTLGVAHGGTGSTTLSGLLKGNGTSAVQSAVAGTDYQAPITLTTTGTSGAATFAGNTLNIPQYAFTDTNTTYTAGTGLTLSSTTFALSSSSIASLALADSALQSGDNVSALTNDAGYISNISAFTTDDLAQGSTNKYFSNALAQGAISVSGAPLTYSGGVIGINQASGSQAGYLSSTDWNTFNNKQNALTAGTDYEVPLTFNSPLSRTGNAISLGTVGIASGGTGTTTGGVANGVEYFDGSKLTNNGSFIYDGSHVGINISNPSVPFQVAGNAIVGQNISGAYYTAAPLALVNSQASTLKTQLNLVNTAGGAGAGSAIDFYTYTTAGNGQPEARIGGIDDGNYSSSLALYTKDPGNTGNNSLINRLNVAANGVVTISNLGTGLVKSTSGVLANATAGTDYVAPSALASYFTLADWHATTTDALAEGGTNKYFTNTRVQDYLDTIAKGYFFSTTSANSWLGTKSTSDLAEGSNLYFTNARADARFVAGLAATTSVSSITALPNLALPYSQLTGAPATENPLTFNYPLTRSGDAISLAFGTTTANSWSALQQFDGGASSSALTVSGPAFLATGSGATSIGTTSQGDLDQKLLVDIGTSTGSSRGVEIVNSASPIGWSGTGGALVIRNTHGSGGTLSPALNVVVGNTSYASISAFGLFEASNASPSNPSYSFGGFGGVNNAGLYYSANFGYLGLATNGTARLTINPAGQVGIGTTTPFGGSLIAGFTVATSTYISGDLTATGTVAFTGLGSAGLVYANPNGALSPVSTSTWTFASSTLLGDNNTFSGTNTFSNTINGSISGNAGTVTNGVYTTTFGGLFASNLAGTTTDALAEGSTNKYYTDARVGNYLVGSTTLPALLNYWTKSGSNISYSAGHVGIGIASPTVDLDVEGSTAGGGVEQKIYNTSSSGDAYAATYIGQGNGANLTLQYFNSSYTAAGLLTPNTGYIQAGPSATGGLTFVAKAAAPITFGTGGTAASNERMIITSTGNIGIGTTSPFAKLSVAGNAYLGGNLTATGTVAFTGLGTGLVKSTSGVLGNAVAGTDYQSPLTAGTDYEVPLTFNSPLSRTGNAISLGTVGIASGGTGTTTAPTLGQILVGNGSGGYKFVATSSLAINLADVTGVLDLSSHATGTLAQANGGTGIASYTPGDVLYADNTGTLTKLPKGSDGQVLKLQAGLPNWGVDQTIGSSGNDGIFATSTGVIYPLDTSNIVVIGSNATSSANAIFEVSGQQYISSKLGIGTTSPTTELSVGGNGYLTGGLGVGVYNPTAGTLRTSGAAYVGGALNVTGATTLATSLNGILKASSGVVSNAVAGTDFQAPLAFTYPLVNTSNTISLAFGTTTANSWSQLQQFSGGASSTQLTTTGTTYLATAGGNVGIG